MLTTIQRLRDDLLADYGTGRHLVAWYYGIGPFAADLIKRNETAKSLVRNKLLTPLSRCSERLVPSDAITKTQE